MHFNIHVVQCLPTISVVCVGLIRKVHSMLWTFRAEFNGRGELSGRQQKLGQHLDAWKKIASNLNIAVVYSNQNLWFSTTLLMQLPLSYFLFSFYVLMILQNLLFFFWKRRKKKEEEADDEEEQKEQKYVWKKDKSRW